MQESENEVYLSGIDIGTSKCVSIILDREFRILGKAQQNLHTNYLGSECVEQKPGEWWSAVMNTLQQAVKTSNVEPARIRCLGISAQTDGILAVNENCEPLGPYLSWMDMRCLPLGKKYPSLPIFAPTLKILWIRENEPEIYKKTHKFVQCGDYLLSKLTGKFRTDNSVASHYFGLFDYRTKKWLKEGFANLNIDGRKLPDIHPSYEIVGKITDEASEKIGLSTKTMVVAGGGDNECSALGAKIIKRGQALLSLGTSAVISMCINEPLLDPKRDLWSFSHTVPDKWLLQFGTNAGFALKWFRENFCQAEKDIASALGINAYEIMDNEAEKLKTEKDDPFFVPSSNYRSYGGALLGLNFRHKKNHIIRAIMEGVAYDIRRAVEIAGKHNVRINELRIVGGGAKSNIWRQIFADVLNRPLLYLGIRETAALGGAILAGIGSQVFNGFSEIPSTSVSEDDPEIASNLVYNDRFQRYKKYCEKLGDDSESRSPEMLRKYT